MGEVGQLQATPSLMSPSLGEDLAPLLRLLQRADAFALAFLRCNVPIERERIVRVLIEELQREGRRGRLLKLDREIADLRAEIVRLEPPLRAGEALFVLGYERSIPSGGSASSLQQLNMSRELFREFPFPVVLVLPEYALTRLARGAPDFWAWRSGVFEVTVDVGRLEGVYREAVALPADGLENLSVERKRERLAVLLELLEEYRRHPGGDPQRCAEVVYEIARLRHFLCDSLGDLDQALECYRESLEVNEELGNRFGMAKSCHQLGRVAEDRGNYDQAFDYYQKSLEINEELNNRSGIAVLRHQLGNVAYLRGEHDRAFENYRESLKINEELGNRYGMAISYHQLGRIAQDRGDYDQALDWYRKSLKIKEALGHRAGMATTMSQMGVLFTLRDEPAEAVPLTLRSLEIHRQIGSPDVAIDLGWLCRQREQLGDERFRAILSEHLDADEQVALSRMLESVPAGE